MKKKLFAVLLSILLIMTLAPTAFAADDATPPVLPSMDGVHTNAPAYNRGDTLTLTLDTVELESGYDLANCQAYFVVLDPQHMDQSVDTFTVHLNTVTASGGLQGSFAFDKTQGGICKLCAIYLWDMRANYKGYESCDDVFPNVSFNLTSDYIRPILPQPVKDGPTLKSFTLSKTKVRVGDTATYTVNASDPSGIISVNMDLDMPFANWYYDKQYPIKFEPVPGKAGTFTGSFKITPDLWSTDYYPKGLTIISGAGKSTYFYSWSDIYTELQNCESTILKVYNPTAPLPRDYPALQSYTISTHQLLPGQQMNVTATVDPKYDRLATIGFWVSRKFHGVWSRSNLYVVLGKTGSSTFSGTLSVPIDTLPGEYFLTCCDCTKNSGIGGGLIEPASMTAAMDDGLLYLKDSGFTIPTILTVSGTDNIAVPVGGTFDAMQGVSANNGYTGDVTDRIQVTGGNIDTSAPGIYLVKYKVEDIVTIDGITSPTSYTDYRWIGVTEVMPTSPGADLVVTDDNILVGASSGEVALTCNGKTIPFTDELTGGGKYTIAAKAAPGAGKYGLNTISATSPVGMRIDKGGPTLSPTWQRVDARTICVDTNLQDPTGIDVMKYLPGKKKIDAVKSSGIAFNGTFNTRSFGYFTIYAIDKKGNETCTVIRVTNIAVKKLYMHPLTSATTYIGSTYQMNVTFNPTNATDQRVSWTSSNKKVAIVDSNGNVTIIGKGKVTITAKCAGKTATCKFTVK